MNNILNLKENELKAIRELKKILSTRVRIVDFKIFGSKVRGNDTSDSDIDIMLVIEKVAPKIVSELDRIIFEINLKYDTFISSIIIGKDEIEKGPMSESPIYKTIQKEGIGV
ncbi:MAG TPA: nucleotidyltransferase domain-containing protein [bacterium]|nr:nucleotidyltransferase domain-containing protein [bacterium]HPP29739.1 nucleotidyltransferase domain-containing protein [bacterium]